MPKLCRTQVITTLNDLPTRGLRAAFSTSMLAYYQQTLQETAGVAQPRCHLRRAAFACCWAALLSFLILSAYIGRRMIS